MKRVIVHTLFASGRLRPYDTSLQRVVKTTLELVDKKIQLTDIDIVIADEPKSAIKHFGVGGYTPNSHLITLSLDPTNRNFETAILTHLPRTLTHELHHSVRWRTTGYGSTLLEAMISEGLADHFDIEVWRKSPNPWSVALNPHRFARLLSRARKIWRRKRYDHQMWFFGSKPKSIPQWTGYSIGFWLVGAYLKDHPEETAVSLVDEPASSFLRDLF